MVDYAEIAYNLSILNMELEGLPDGALMEECLYYGQQFQCDDLNIIGLRFGVSGVMSKKERKKLEGIYILMYNEIAWEE